MMRYPCFSVLLALAFLAPQAFEATAAWADEAGPTPASSQNSADDDPDSPEHTFLGGPDPPCMLPCGIVMLILILVALVVALALAVLAVVLPLVLLFVVLLAAAFVLAFGIVFVAFLVLAALVLCAVLVALGFGASLALVAAAVLLPCVGIAGISVAVGFLRHSVRSAFRAAFIQVGALAGTACGIGLLDSLKPDLDLEWAAVGYGEGFLPVLPHRHAQEPEVRVGWQARDEFRDLA
jgi:hypothetical protein